jgi:hypothetical protein
MTDEISDGLQHVSAFVRREPPTEQTSLQEGMNQCGFALVGLGGGLGGFFFLLCRRGRCKWNGGRALFWLLWRARVAGWFRSVVRSTSTLEGEAFRFGGRFSYLLAGRRLVRRSHVRRKGQLRE